MTTKAEPENAIAKWVSGKKTYAVALTILACGILKHYSIEIPDFAWAALAALGLAFLRAGVQKGK